MSPQQPVGKIVGVADRFAQGKSDRCVFGFQGLTHFQEAGGIFGHSLETGSLDLAVAIHQTNANHAQRYRNPLAIAHAVFAEDVIPTAVTVAERHRQIADIEQLGRILMRVIEPAQHDIGTAADIGRYRRLRPHVFETFAVGAYRHPGQFSEFPGIGIPHILVALHKPLPAQYPQRGPFFYRVHNAGTGSRCGKSVGADGSGCGGRSTGPQKSRLFNVVMSPAPSF